MPLDGLGERNECRPAQPSREQKHPKVVEHAEMGWILGQQLHERRLSFLAAAEDAQKTRTLMPRREQRAGGLEKSREIEVRSLSGGHPGNISHLGHSSDRAG